jgi:flagellar biosynthetic protein FlhB
MAEDDDSKTEAPTGKRLSKAREEGDLVQSQEVKTAAMLTGITVLVWFILPPILAKIRDGMTPLLAQPHLIRVTTEGELMQALLGLLSRIGVLILVPILFLLAVGLTATFAQTGFLFTTSKLVPDLNKLNPLNGVKRMFSLPGLVDFGKSMVKLLLLVVLFYFVMRSRIEALPLLPTLDLPQILEFLHQCLIRLLFSIAFVQIVIGAADYFWQRHTFMKRHRMTKQEVKDEHRQTEGDPMVKARLRNLRAQRARQRMMAAVPKADVVVTNPTHFACALKYDPDTMNAPVLLAKGQDLVALRIRELAQQHDITIVENPPLARALYAAVEIDREIPPEHYKAVAEVISYVFRLKGKLRR